MAATGENYVSRIQMSVSSRRLDRQWHDQPRLVAEPAKARIAEPAFLSLQSDGRGFQLRQRVQDSGFGRGEEGPGDTYDRFAGLVAGGFWTLRRPLHPHGLAQ